MGILDLCPSSALVGAKNKYWRMNIRTEGVVLIIISLVYICRYEVDQWTSFLRLPNFWCLLLFIFKKTDTIPVCVFKSQQGFHFHCFNICIVCRFTFFDSTQSSLTSHVWFLGLSSTALLEFMYRYLRGVRTLLLINTRLYEHYY